MQQHWLTKNVLGFSLASFFSDFSHEMATAILPSFISSLTGTHAAPQALGILSGVANAFSSLIKVGAGMVSDSLIYRKPLIIIGNSMVGIFITLLGTTHTVAAATLYQTLAWIGRAILGPARDSLLTLSTSKSHYGKIFGFHRAMDTLGAIIGPLTAAFLLLYLSPSSIFLIAGIPAACSLASIFFLVTDIPHPTKVHYYNTFNKLPFSFIIFLGTIFIFGLGNFNKTLLLLRMQGSVASPITSFIIMLYTLLNISRALSEYVIGYLADKVSRKYLLAVGFFLFALLSGTLIYPHPHPLFIILIFIGAGISTAIVKVVTKVYTATLLSSSMQGTGFGLLEATHSISELCANLTVGFLWTHVSASIAFSYATLLTLVATILHILFSTRL